MRKVGRGRALATAGHLAAAERLRALNPKFHAGPNPLEREANLNIIQPTNAQQVARMTEVLSKTYNNAQSTPEEKQAFALWQFQVSQGTVTDEVKLEFLRGFYFWLLGRGDQKDHDKTMWGRANAAVYNKEVASYIDQFVSKRAKYAYLLQLLSMRVPTTLNGYYLYYKYIVRGALQKVKDKDGIESWDMSNEDYLQDFDIFQQELEDPSLFGSSSRSKYGEVIGPQANRPSSQEAFEGTNPYPITEQGLRSAGRDPKWAFNSAKQEEKLDAAISAQTPSMQNRKGRKEREQEEADAPAAGPPSDTLGDNIEAAEDSGFLQGEGAVPGILDFDSTSEIPFSPVQPPPKDKEEVFDTPRDDSSSIALEPETPEAVNNILKSADAMLKAEDMLSANLDGQFLLEWMDNFTGLAERAREAMEVHKDDADASYFWDLEKAHDQLVSAATNTYAKLNQKLDAQLTAIFESSSESPASLSEQLSSLIDQKKQLSESFEILRTAKGYGLRDRSKIKPRNRDWSFGTTKEPRDAKSIGFDAEESRSVDTSSQNSIAEFITSVADEGGSMTETSGDATLTEESVVLTPPAEHGEVGAQPRNEDGTYAPKAKAKPKKK